MVQPDVIAELTSLYPTTNGDPPSAGVADAPPATTLARTHVRLEQAKFEIELGVRVQERLLREIDRLEQRVADVEAERLELLEQVNHRDRLLTQVFSSRSWRWTQALRRRLGRR